MLDLPKICIRGCRFAYSEHGQSYRYLRAQASSGPTGSKPVKCRQGIGNRCFPSIQNRCRSICEAGRPRAPGMQICTGANCWLQLGRIRAPVGARFQASTASRSQPASGQGGLRSHRCFARRRPQPIGGGWLACPTGMSTGIPTSVGTVSDLGSCRFG